MDNKKKIEEISFKGLAEAFAKGDLQWHEKELNLFFKEIQTKNLSEKEIIKIQDLLSIKLIRVSHKYFAIINEEDFEKINHYTWTLSGGYARTYKRFKKINGGKRKGWNMHQLVLEKKQGEHIDHINGNRLDNRRENLRSCTRSQNLMNRIKQKNNKSGFKGVSWHKASNSWRATIVVNKKQKTVKTCSNLIEAVFAYDIECEKLHGSFARTNFQLKEWQEYTQTIQNALIDSLLAGMPKEKNEYRDKSEHEYTNGFNKAVAIIKQLLISKKK